MVNNALSPHGGRLVERVMEPEKAREKIQGLTAIPVGGQLARECISIAYGFFSPLEGFMLKADVDSVTKDMRLTSGYIWSIPIVFDMSEEEIKQIGLKEGETLLLTYQNQPLATLDIEEIYSYDKEYMAQRVYGTTDDKHPGVRRTYACKDKFLGGKVTLVTHSSEDAIPRSAIMAGKNKPISPNMAKITKVINRKTFSARIFLPP